MPVFETDQLLELVGRKYQVLAELCELGRRQLELIGRDEMVELLEVLWSKQQSIALLHDVQRGLDPLRNQLPEDRNWRTAADRTRCAAMLEQCELLLREILEQERRSEQLLTQQRDLTAARLDGAHMAGQARHAYLASQPRAESQLDLSSQE